MYLHELAETFNLHPPHVAIRLLRHDDTARIFCSTENDTATVIRSAHQDAVRRSQGLPSRMLRDVNAHVGRTQAHRA